MPKINDGPQSARFGPLSLCMATSLSDLAHAGVSPAMRAALAAAPSGPCVGWGIPFVIDQMVVVDQATRDGGVDADYRAMADLPAYL